MAIKAWSERGMELRVAEMCEGRGEGSLVVLLLAERAR